ncbi:MAG: DNA helicase UvrD, partial [Elusimicrobia bacterium]|nr:DNA helicase UvrD [Elusimicrobiota bacterium]
MKFFADFHIHSKYSRNTHPDMEIPTLAKWAKIKGLSLLGTGDFTHPQWLVELKKFLKPTSGRGVYEYDDVRFILTTVVSCHYTRGGRNYKIHHLLFAPNFSTADRLIDALGRYGDLETEARPSISLTAEDLVKAVLDVSPDVLVVPAHAWGLHHTLFSPQFGYDRLVEAYGAQSENIRILETGLSCDPGHAHRWKQIDGRTLISNSNAHHPSHLGREANIFDCPMDYKDMTLALLKNDHGRFLGTVEMFPEEDRYYSSGHRACQSRASQDGGLGVCAACGKPCVPGVSERVEALADRTREEAARLTRPFHKLVSLQDIIADAMGFQPDAESVQKQYLQITTQTGPELSILLDWTEEQIRKQLPARVAEGVLALRQGEISIEKGYDGVPG